MATKLAYNMNSIFVVFHIRVETESIEIDETQVLMSLNWTKNTNIM